MNPRIHEIIGTLQLLNEELQHNQGSAEVLGKIKLFSAQLYLESDMELISVQREISQVMNQNTNSEEPLEVQKEVVEASEEIELPIDDDHSEVEVEVEVEATEENVSEDLQNSQPSLFGFEPETTEEIEIEEEEVTVNEDSLVSGIELIIKKPEVEVVENQMNEESVVPPSKEITPDVIKQANEVLSMFSLSRRFEFANFLFGGDMQKFTTFICEMILAPSGDEREDVYDLWYQRFDWKRRDESANDLKRNLRKMM